MRDLFPGYYRPTEDEFHELWHTCDFVLDTSALLDLYRVSNDTRDDLLATLRALSDRLWVPYQVAAEYQARRLEVIAGEELAYTRTIKDLEKMSTTLRQRLESKRHPHVSDAAARFEALERVFEEIKNELRERDAAVGELVEQDVIRDEIDDILKEKIGRKPTADTLSDIYREGKRRFRERIPPGYEDAEKTFPECYGDLVIWEEMLAHAGEVARPVVMATSDQKADWWYQLGSRRLGPRPELVTEFRDRTGQMFHMYETSQFVRYAQEHLEGVEEREATFDELRNLAAAQDQWLDTTAENLRSLQDDPRWLPRFILDLDLEAARRATQKDAEALSRAMQVDTEALRRAMQVDTEALRRALLPVDAEALSRAMQVDTEALRRALLLVDAGGLRRAAATFEPDGNESIDEDTDGESSQKGD